MSIFTGILVFGILWWLVFFVTLPFGVKTEAEAGREPKEGHARSAPSQPRLGLKALIATGITTVLWLGVYYAITHDLYSFRVPVQ